MSKRVAFRVYDLVVQNHNDSPIWRIKEMDKLRCGVIDACIEHQHKNIQIQWIDKSLLMAPTRWQQYIPTMKKFYDAKDPQGAADFIAEHSGAMVDAGMDAARIVGFKPEFYPGGGIRIHI